MSYLLEAKLGMKSDAELLKRLQERDEGAFNVLLSRHCSAVRLRILRIVRGRSAAEDLVQDVFLRLWTHAGQYTGEGSVRGWLGRMATNLALNHVRSVRRRRQRPLAGSSPSWLDDPETGEADWLVDAVGSRPDELAARAERWELLAGLIDDLPESKRRVWQLVHEQEMAIAAAAEQLGIPVGTVKSRLHDTRRRLADAWKEIDSDWEIEQ